jgi:hypothetical protein
MYFTSPTTPTISTQGLPAFLPSGKGQLFAVSGPGKSEHVATGEFGELYESSAGQRLFPNFCALPEPRPSKKTQNGWRAG